jgi:hypothetical protein
VRWLKANNVPKTKTILEKGLAVALSCSQFTDFLSRRAEQLDDAIVRDFHPRGEWIGHVSVGRFKAEDGVEHTLS